MDPCSDADTGTTLTYTLDDDGGGPFTLRSGATDFIDTNGALDYDTDIIDQYVVKVKVSDSVNSVTVTVYANVCTCTK